MTHKEASTAATPSPAKSKPRRRREPFGRIDKRGRSFRARYLHAGELHSAPQTFPNRGTAQVWLQEQRLLIANGKWVPPQVQAVRDQETGVTVAQYYPGWIKSRTNSKGRPLADRTRSDYLRLLRAPGEAGPEHPGGPLAPFLKVRIKDITASMVRKWWAEQLAGGKLTQASRSYGLLRAILNTALEDEIIETNPCNIKGATSVTTGVEVVPPTDEQLEGILAAIDPMWRLFIVIEAIGGLRFGEVSELRGCDIEVVLNDDAEVYATYIHVSRAVVYTAETGQTVKETKSAAGKRTVILLGQDAKDLAARCAQVEEDQLLFPAVSNPDKHVDYSGLWHRFNRARIQADAPKVTMHALRHYAGTRYAQTGATVKETMTFLGHSSHLAAMRYQHAGSRSLELAQAMQLPTAANKVKPPTPTPPPPQPENPRSPGGSTDALPARCDGKETITVGKDGRIGFQGIAWQVSRHWAGKDVTVAWKGNQYWISAPNGAVLIQHERPQEKVRVVTAGGKRVPTPREVGMG